MLHGTMVVVFLTPQTIVILCLVLPQPGLFQSRLLSSSYKVFVTCGICRVHAVKILLSNDVIELIPPATDLEFLSVWTQLYQ